jgi:hypothetical protein
MRRLVWFVSGVVAGISAFVWAKKKIAVATEMVSPAGIRRRTAAKFRSLPARTKDALHAGRVAFNSKAQQSSRGRQR